MLAALTLSAAGFIGIVTHESFRSEAYDDGVGVTTIGFGTTTGVKPGDKITVERALAAAMKDAEKHGDAVRRCVKVPLYQHEFDALVSFSYNVGASAFCGSTLVKKLNTGDYVGGCAEISRWTFARGRDCNVRSNNCYGVVLRRIQERALCEGRA